MPIIKLKEITTSNEAILDLCELGFNKSTKELKIGTNDGNYLINVQSRIIRKFTSTTIPTTVIKDEIIYITDLNRLYVGIGNSYVLYK